MYSKITYVAFSFECLLIVLEGIVIVRQIDKFLICVNVFGDKPFLILILMN
jgi:hypothetical protein